MIELSQEEFKKECSRIQTYGKKDWSMGESDLNTFLERNNGSAFMDVYIGRCERIAHKAILQLYMQNYSKLKSAVGVLVNFKTHSDFCFFEVDDAMRILGKSLSDGTDLAFTTTCEDTMAKDYAKVTIIMAGVKEPVDQIVEEVALCFEINKALNDKFIDLAQKHKKTNAQFLEEILNEYCSEKPVDISALIR
jgi:cell division GTPase FtsZ